MRETIEQVGARLASLSREERERIVAEALRKATVGGER